MCMQKCQGALESRALPESRVLGVTSRVSLFTEVLEVELHKRYAQAMRVERRKDIGVDAPDYQDLVADRGTRGNAQNIILFALLSP